MPTPPAARFVVNYHLPDGDEYQDEYAEMVPAIGNGVIMHPNSTRYRIVDVWHVYLKRGALQPHGIHAFLEIADAASDRPLAMYPDYYGREES